MNREVNYHQLINQKPITKSSIKKKFYFKINPPLNPDSSAYDEISIVNDDLFKAVLGNDSKIHIIASFLSIILDMDYDSLVKKIDLHQNEISKDTLKEKIKRLDILIKYENTLISLEMNNENTLVRNSHYVRKLAEKTEKYIDKDGKERKRYKYETIIQININNFMFKDNDEPVEVYKIRDENNHLLANQNFINIYLPLLDRKMKKEGIESLNRKEKLILALTNTNQKKVQEIIKGDKEMKNILEEIDEIRRNEVDNPDGDPNKLWMLTNFLAGEEQGEQRGIKKGMEEGIKKGIKEGIKEGEQKGIKKANLETMKRMFKDGIANELIAKYTDLDINTVNKFCVREGSTPYK